MDEYEEVDFWGGESPSARQTSPQLLRANGAEGCEMALDDESEDEEDSEDEVMFEDEEDEEEEEEEGDGPMELELIGHR